MDTKLKKSNKPVFITAYIVCVISFLASIVCIIGAARLNSYSGYMDPYFLESNGFSSFSEFLEQQGGNLALQMEALEEHMKVWIILAIAMGIIALLSLIYLVVAVGERSGDGKIRLNQFDRVFAEVQLAAICLIFFSEAGRSFRRWLTAYSARFMESDGIRQRCSTLRYMRF